MNRWRILAAGLVLIASGQVLGADEGAVKAAAGSSAAAKALSPEVQDAIAGLSAEDFKTRQAALTKLEVALGQQMRAMVSTDDPEVQARLACLLEFNEGLTRWVLETMKLPTEQRKGQLDFGLQPEILPTMALVFSPEGGKRAEGARQLGKQKSPEATGLLVRLLDDPDRVVYVATMEAVWDRKPTDAIIDSLWNRAVDSGFANYRQVQPQQMPQPGNVMFRGKAVGVGNMMFFNNNFQNQRGQDSGLACDVLVNLKSPRVSEKIKDFLESLEKMMVAQPWLLNNNTEQLRNLFRLVEAYKPKDAMLALYRMSTGEVRQRCPVVMNNERFFYSNRTMALAALISITGQKPEDYQIKRMVLYGGMWMAPSEDDETKSIKQMQEWLAANGEPWGLKGAGQAATRPGAEGPATQPVAAPLPLQQGGVGGIQIQGNLIMQGGMGVIHMQVGPGVNEVKDKDKDKVKEKDAK